MGSLTEREPHDAHIRAAERVFRDCGFTLAAVRFPRSEASLTALKRFNGLPDDAKVPPGWHYHPNASLAAKDPDPVIRAWMKPDD